LIRVPFNAGLRKPRRGFTRAVGKEKPGVASKKTVDDYRLKSSMFDRNGDSCIFRKEVGIKFLVVWEKKP
jgi:hypothetical protein